MTALENVELVVAYTDAHNAGDLDAAMEFCTPDVDAFPDASVFPEAGPLHGRDALKTWTREIDSAWIEARWETSSVMR